MFHQYAERRIITSRAQHLFRVERKEAVSPLLRRIRNKSLFAATHPVRIFKSRKQTKKILRISPFYSLSSGLPASMVSMDKLRLETSLASEQGKTFDDIFKSQGKRKCTL